jgi:tape measure domain-containing protein
LSTISQNNIVVNYVVTSDQIAKTKTEFDKLTEAEKKAVDEAKKLSDQLKKTGQEGQDSGKKTETSLTKITGPIKQNSAALSAFTSQLKIAGDAATTAANKASAGFAGAEAAQRKSTAAANAFRNALTSISPAPITKVKEESQNAAKELNGFSSIVKSGAGLLAGYFSLSTLIAFKDKLVETTIKFEGYSKAIEFGSGNAENFARNQQFLNDLINKYGLGLASTTEAYKSFFNASTLAGQSQQETNRQFEAVTKAGTVLKLTTDQMQGAFLALGQMMSKGTVQAEELRGQLGERIPGAFSIMAKALGVNERQLNKMLEQGQVLSKDALPKFAAELEKTFGPNAEKNLNGLVNAQNRFNTAMDKMILTIGNGLGPSLNRAYESAANFLSGLNSLLISEQEKVQNQINENQAKNLDKYIKGLEKVSDAGVKNVIENAKKEKIAIIEEDKQREQLFKILLEKRKLVNETTKGTFFSRRALVKEIDEEIKLLQEGNIKRAKTIADYNAQISAANDELAKREKERVTEKVGLTDAELKALKAQYDAKLKLLEIEKRIADINIEVTTEREDERTLKLLRNAEKFGKDKLAIDREFAALNVKDAENNAKLQAAIVKKQGNDVKVELKKQSDGFRDAEEKYDKEQLEAAKKLEEAKQKARKASMDKSQDDAKEMMKQSEEISKKSIEDEYKRIQKAEEEKAAIIQQTYDLAVNTTNSLFELQSQYAANEMARKNKQFDEEIRLADGNVQKITEIEEKRRAAEKEYREKEFKANQMQAIANVVFQTAPIIAKYAAGIVTAPLAIIAAASAAAQIGFILAQPVPEFAEGTKGKKFKGRAIVGEQGTEKVVTQSGKVYYTPGVATLAQFDEPVQIIPNNQLGLNDRKQLSLIYGSTSRTNDSGGRIIEKLSNIESGLKNMPVAAISLDEKGFMKKVRTPNRSTTILNNRFKN